jgi:endonuclease/exonuclease/phosphatase family metal-dependent hydrolase
MNVLHSVTRVLLMLTGALSGCVPPSSDNHDRPRPPKVDQNGENLEVIPKARSRHHEPNPAHAVAELDAGLDDPWSSPAACESLLAQGRRHGHRPGMARLGTWNVRWFPDGAPGHAPPPGKATDLSWFACAVAWLDVDALALQEVKADPTSLSKLDWVVASLNRRTGGAWIFRLDECPAASGQHVAWLYDEKRAKATTAFQYAAVNPHASACAEQLRPGFGITFKFPGGLDLHAISVHLKSGVEARDLRLRRQSWAVLPGIAANEGHRSNDSDIVILGDFNSMGCKKCESASDT